MNVMHIEMIDTVHGLRRLKENWNAVYEADPEAQFFLSWTWMSKWLTGIGDKWFVLAARPGDDGAARSIAFLPMRWRSSSRKDGFPRRELVMAGNRGADYTGFICAHEFQEQAIPAFARYIGQLDWTVLNLEFLRASDERISLFLRNLPRGDRHAREIPRRSGAGEVDLCVCPYIELPGSWEAYLGSLSANARQNIRRILRRIETSDEFRISLATVADTPDHLTILLRLWASRWAEQKGDMAGSIEKMVRVMCMHCAAQGALFLPILWKGETPLAALVSFIDRKKKSLLFYIGGRDSSWRSPPPGLALHAYSIRYAIENGFSTYDFLRGDEPYKYGFGAAERRIRHVVVSTPSGPKFDVV